MSKKDLKNIKSSIQLGFQLFRKKATEVGDCRSTCPFITECKRGNKTLCELINHTPADRLEKPFEDPRQYKMFEEDKQ